MTPVVKAKVLAAAAALSVRAGEMRPGFAARALERESVRAVARPMAAPRTVAG